MKSLSVLCAVAAVLACVLAAQAAQEAKKVGFFRDIPGPKKIEQVAEDKKEAVGHGLRIYHGNVATRKQFPYQAVLFIDLSVFCGGSLIAENWVLTAAHCVEGGHIWYVLLGGTQSIAPVQEGRTTYVTRGGIRHPDYDAQDIINDVGLVQLNRPAVLSSYVQTIALTPPDVSYIGSKAVVSGFGKTSDLSGSTISPVLKYTTLVVVANKVCAKAYGNSTLDESIICLSAEGSSSCSGDSGGPLTVTNADGKVIQIGTVSFGASAGCSLGYPVGYGNIALFIDWIEETTALSFSK